MRAASSPAASCWSTALWSPTSGPTATIFQVIKVPATTIADELGNPKGTNIVMLGALACASDLYDEAAMRHAVEHYFGKKGKVNPKNAQCFDRGADEARKQL